MEIKILGSGCKNCLKLEEVAKEVTSELGIEANFSKVTNIDDIIDYGVMSTPAMVIGGKVVIQGGIPSKKKMIKILKG